MPKNFLEIVKNKQKMGNSCLEKPVPKQEMRKNKQEMEKFCLEMAKPCWEMTERLAI